MPYRFTELTGERFQTLCQALIVQENETATCLPSNQADGGRDAYIRTKDTYRVFQCKWTAKSIPNPAGWIMQQLEAEEKNILTLKSEGLTHYTIVTNIAATARPRSGSLDQLRFRLQELSTRYEVEFSCWWQDDLTTRLNLAPDALKISFPEILIGFDAYRATLQGLIHGERMARTDSLIRRIMRTGWERDRYSYFKQLEQYDIPLEDVFVDVLATGPLADTSPAPKTPSPRLQSMPASSLLFSRPSPNALHAASSRRLVLLGAPGQGKSSLLQVVCQIHRASLLGEDYNSPLEYQPLEEDFRVALRIELRDYAIWLDGKSPFEVSSLGVYEDLPAGVPRTLEQFIARQMSVDSGGSVVTVEDFNDMAERLPLLLALDGLDEIADRAVREAAIVEIEACVARLDTTAANFQCIVTSRPSFSSQAEPSGTSFTYYELDPMSDAHQRSYLVRWSKANRLNDSNAKQLGRNFEKFKDNESFPDLATNPMQLNILLHLMHAQGVSIPTHRTQLFSEYVKLFLSREADKSDVVATHIPEIRDLIQFLGWHLQAEAESDSANGRSSLKHIHRVLRHYRADKGEDVKVVPLLFTAVTERVWVITSRSQGSFEFDVQSLREYLAAFHILEEEPSDYEGGPDGFAKFVALTHRPYWANTARFMAGMFRKGERSGLVDVLLEELNRPDVDAVWLRNFLRTVIADGSFDNNKLARRRLVQGIHDDLGLRAHHQKMDLPNFAPLGPNQGGVDLAHFLTMQIESALGHPLCYERAELLSAHMKAEDLCDWWIARVEDAPSSEERLRWLEVLAGAKFGHLLSDAQSAAILTWGPSAAKALVASGATPPRNSRSERVMVEAVLRGELTELAVPTNSLAADILETFRPVALAAPLLSDESSLQKIVELRLTPHSLPQVQSLRRQFLTVKSGFNQLLAALGKSSNANSTEYLVATSQALSDEFGPNWLANEILVYAAANFNLVAPFVMRPPAYIFGARIPASVVLHEIRKCRNDPRWWLDQAQAAVSSIDVSTWCLAVASCAGPKVIAQLFPALAKQLDRLDATAREILDCAAARIALMPGTRRIGGLLIEEAANANPSIVGLLLGFADPNRPIPNLSNTAIEQLVRSSRSAWRLVDRAVYELALPRDAADALKLLEISGPKFRAITDRNRPIRGHLADAILSKPHAFPWQIVANASSSLGRTTETLRAESLSKRWFAYEDERDL